MPHDAVETVDDDSAIVIPVANTIVGTMAPCGLVARFRRVVWNEAERRPRMPARIGIAALLVIASILAIGLVVGAVSDETRPLSVLVLATLVAQGLPVVITLVVAAFVDRRTIIDLGLGIDRDWWVDLGFGVGLGAALMTGIFLIALGLGWIEIVGWFAVRSDRLGFGSAFLFMIALFAVSGLSEELLVRGYLLTNIAEGLVGYLSHRLAVGVAVVVSAAVFGAAHVMNPNATLVSTVGIALAGVLLATGYVLTGDLAIPIGLHVAWNLFQGPVYGFAVSGVGFGMSVVDTVETGPDVATGGEFGPEAGVLGVAAIAVGIPAIAWYVHRRYGTLRVNERLTQPALRWRSD